MSRADEIRQALETAMKALDRIKTSDLTMDGFTTYHGRLSMDETVAVNELFAFVADWLDGPTDEDVEVAAQAAYERYCSNMDFMAVWVPHTKADWKEPFIEQARAVLEAVRVRKEQT